MLFNSLNFLLFFPVVCLGYYLLPQKPQRIRTVWLLVASYFFYMCWNAKYLLLLIFSTLLTFVTARLIAAAKTQAARRGWLAACLVGNLSILFFFKYISLAIESVNALLGLVHFQVALPGFNLLLPVGISFYTFQALSYTIDVYRGELQPEPSLLRYALFVSFFPQLVAGPIERSGHLLKQMYTVHPFDFGQVCAGLQLMVWGFFEKLVIADQAAMYVDAVFDDYAQYGGVERALGLVLFALQLYCDFGGYSHIAIGAAQVLGFDLMQNFRQPYLAPTVGDFWRRWHISLSTWLRDYIYFPLGGSRCSALRRSVNLMITFFISGLWHGAAWHYVAWGVLHGAYQIVGRLTGPLRKTLRGKIGINEATAGYKLWQRTFVFCLTCISYAFFRGQSCHQAVSYLGGILGWFDPWVITDGTLFRIGLKPANFVVLGLAVAVLFAVDCLHEKGVRLRAALGRQWRPLRWLVYYAAVFSVLVCGIWGPGYDAAAFIYFQF